jgi:subtilisin family serine protease
LAGVTARDYVASQVLVAIPLARAADPGGVANDYGLMVDGETSLPSLGLRLVTFTVVRPRGLGDLLDLIGLDSRVQSAQPVFRYRINAGLSAALPHPSYPALNMRLPSARLLASGTGVVVSLIDTHVAHLPSLRGHVVERVALVPGGDGLHGTALAGLIAAIAPDARLIAIEAFDERANGPNGDAEATTLTLARAIDVALNRKSDVINLSITGPRDPLIGRMVRHALSQGTILVAAAGNEGPTAPPRYPAAYDGVIAVTATDSRDQLYALAARGPHVAVAAPGVDVPVELPDAMVGYFSGTSVAAAEVSGIAALLRERAPRLASGEARRLLKETATPMPAGGPGLVDAFAALSRVSPLAQR